MEKQTKRVTIGVIAGGITDEFTKYVCKGAMVAARAADENLVIVPGKYIDSDLSDRPELMYEYQYTTAFSYPQKENIDALVVSLGSVGCFTTEEKQLELMQKYEGIPCVLVASKLEGYPHVVFDNSTGIKEAITYLIEKNGCTCFGMLTGNDGNNDSRERKQAFIEVLADHGIAVTDRNFCVGELSDWCMDACAKLLDDNPGLEAVFCANDAMASAMYKELKRRGLQPGRDVYVLGYDDTIAASQADPSLSSVRADPAKLGEEAFNMALRLAKGEQVEDCVVPTYFIMRDSFVRSWNEEEQRVQKSDEDDAGFENVFYWYMHEGTHDQIEEARAGYKRMMQALRNGFEGCMPHRQKRRQIMGFVDEFLGMKGLEYADMDNLLMIFEHVYSTLIAQQADDYGRYRLRDFFAKIYRKLVVVMNRQFGIDKNRKDADSQNLKLFAQHVLQFETSDDDNYRLVLSELSCMGVRDAAIYMLPQQQKHLFREPFEAPDYLYLKAAMKDGIAQSVVKEDQKLTLADIIENKYLQSEERFERVLFPLYSNEQVLGILICSMEESLFVNGEFLNSQVCSAIRMLLLLRANEEIHRQLAENLEALKAHNTELSRISRSDMLTGILNRRGFYDDAEKKLAYCRQEGKRVLVLYVDMNNLKVINDRYGHEDGDFALKTIGRLMVETVGEDAVVGRIGGDEYVSVLEYDHGSDGTELLQKLHMKFEAFNADSEKPYNVTVSAGICLLEPGDMRTLDEAMISADEKLYMEKQLKDKNVEKRK